jgi:hypothetical protein
MLQHVNANNHTFPKEFAPVVNKLIECNWKLMKSNPNQIIFKKKVNDYDYFDISINENQIRVAIPLKSVPNTYVTKFKSSNDACNFINMHLMNYEENELQ